MVRALLIAALASAALAVPVPAPAPANATDDAYIPTLEELEAPAQPDFLASMLDAYQTQEEAAEGGAERLQDDLRKMIKDFGMPAAALYGDDDEEEEEGAAANGTATNGTRTAHAKPASDAAIPSDFAWADADEEGGAEDVSLDTSAANTDSSTAGRPSTNTKRDDGSIPTVDSEGEMSMDAMEKEAKARILEMTLAERDRIIDEAVKTWKDRCEAVKCPKTDIKPELTRCVRAADKSLLSFQRFTDEGSIEYKDLAQECRDVVKMWHEMKLGNGQQDTDIKLLEGGKIAVTGGGEY